MSKRSMFHITLRFEVKALLWVEDVILLEFSLSFQVNVDNHRLS